MPSEKCRKITLQSVGLLLFYYLSLWATKVVTTNKIGMVQRVLLLKEGNNEFNLLKIKFRNEFKASKTTVN